MNIKQIETFVRIVELGTFQAAADALSTSTSTISARVKELERYLGFELFDRSFHRAQLTAGGQDLFERARQLVDFTASLTQQVRNPKAVTGLVRIGAVGVIANTWLVDLVERVRGEYPNVTLRIDANLTRQLLERLADGRLDLAMVAGVVNDPLLHNEPIGQDHFVWMAGAQTPLGEHRAEEVFTPVQLARFPMLALTEDSHHYPIIRAWFRDAGAVAQPMTSSNHMNVLAELTARGLGISLLPRGCYRGLLRQGRLVELRTEPALAPVPFSIVYRKDRVPALAQAIARIARELAAAWADDTA